MLRRHKLLFVTGFLFLVWYNNFDQAMSFYWSYTLLLKPPILICSCEQ